MTDVEEAVEFADFCQFCESTAWPELSEFEDDTAKHPDPIDRDLWEQCQRVAANQGGEIDGYTVKFVGFAPLKVRYMMDVIEGANPMVDGFVPKNEIWIDSGNAAKNWPYVLFHECFEVRLMKQGLSYNAAHKRANAVERVLRIEGGLGVQAYERRLPRIGVVGKLLNQGFKLLGGRLFGLFERQRQSVLTKLRGFFVGKTGTATELVPGVDSLWDAEDAEIDLRATAYHTLEQLVVNGSHLELESAVGARIRRLARLEHRVDKLRLQLPPKVRRGIDEGLAEVMAADYWSVYPEKMRDQLRVVLSEAAQQGQDLDTVSARIREVMGPDRSRASAERIARTETTMAMNAGMELSRRHLAELGLVIGKRWLAVDPRMVTSHPTRREHAKAHNQEVPVDGLFLVGNEVARFPGDPRLSAGMRINCRCLSASIRRKGQDD